MADLRVGDYVVHAVHGIGQYLGLRAETILGAKQDYLDLRYAGSDRMLVPVTQMHQIAKYAAAEGASPRLSRMGGADWARWLDPAVPARDLSLSLIETDEIWSYIGKKEARASLVRANPQGRLVTPTEVADTIVWLVSAEASAITGQAIAVAGGEVTGG